MDYGWHRYNLYPDSFTFGEGLLAGSSIPGSPRLVFCSWSSQWDGFFVSSLVGAAYTFHGVGVNYVALRGMAAEPSVVLLNHKTVEIQVRVEPVNVEPIWAGYASPDGEPLIGFFALQQALYDRYAREYTKGDHAARHASRIRLRPIADPERDRAAQDLLQAGKRRANSVRPNSEPVPAKRYDHP